MWRKPKEINVSSTSMVELKAELSRKRAEFQADKKKYQSTVGPQLAATSTAATTSRINTSSNDPTLISKKMVNKSSKLSKVLPKSQTTTPLDPTEDPEVQKRLREEVTDDQLKRSYEALRKKAKLYDALQSEEEFKEAEVENVLVDFDVKLNERVGTEVEEEEKPENDDSTTGIDEWVEYEVEFGRTRYARRSELAKQNQKSASEEYMEQKRKQWDEEFEKRLQEPIGPKYYEEDKEIRTKGVGHFRFSLNEEERKAQQEELRQLRERTAVQRARAEEIKQKRRALKEERLRKLRERREERENNFEPSSSSDEGEIRDKDEEAGSSESE